MRYSINWSKNGLTSQKTTGFQVQRFQLMNPYTPRKPHKNGLLAWVMATKSYETNKPYVLDIIPHLLKLRNPFVSGQDSIREFMNRWAHPNKVHIVADAAFGSMKLQ